MWANRELYGRWLLRIVSKRSVSVCSNHDGRFTLEELLEFTDLLRLRSRFYQPYEFQAQMQGYCTLQLWKALSQEGGQKIFLEW